MRKLLLSSIVLLIFSIFVSCQKGANKIVFVKDFEIWTANIDGTNAQQIATIPNNGDNIRISTNGSKIIFAFSSSYFMIEKNSPLYYSDVYSCNIDGSDLKKIMSLESQSYYRTNIQGLDIAF